MTIYQEPQGDLVLTITTSGLNQHVRVTDLAYTPIMSGVVDLFPTYIQPTIRALERYTFTNPQHIVPTINVGTEGWVASGDLINHYARLHKLMKSQTTPPWNSWASDTYIGVGPYEYVGNQVVGTTDQKIAALTDLLGSAYNMISYLYNYLDLHYDSSLEQDPIIANT